MRSSSRTPTSGRRSISCSPRATGSPASCSAAAAGIRRPPRRADRPSTTTAVPWSALTPAPPGRPGPPTVDPEAVFTGVSCPTSRSASSSIAGARPDRHPPSGPARGAPVARLPGTPGNAHHPVHISELTGARHGRTPARARRIRARHELAFVEAEIRRLRMEASGRSRDGHQRMRTPGPADRTEGAGESMAEDDRGASPGAGIGGSDSRMYPPPRSRPSNCASCSVAPEQLALLQSPYRCRRRRPLGTDDLSEHRVGEPRRDRDPVRGDAPTRWRDATAWRATCPRPWSDG